MPPIIHRDFKSANIFLASINPSDPVVAKVGDFGVSSTLVLQGLREAKANKRAVNNPTWLAPEILSYVFKSVICLLHPPFSSGEEYSLASDVYSFGLVLWELWTAYVIPRHLKCPHLFVLLSHSKHPFEEFVADIEKEDAIRGGARPLFPDDCWPEYAALAEQCWVRQDQLGSRQLTLSS